ncbi:hypothetical protein ACFL6M_06540 [Candidatus Eisenbacteria bacterium]|uniref:Uncharacterized protein n=1 Tax=Eiseniibacteriota bacterium TaxID=2212470 RepID=A0ABV6YM64_UNCEI
MESSQNEKLARFLTSRSHYSPGNRVVKARAFMPHDEELSVFCVAGLPYSDIVALGDNLNLPPQRRLHGHAILGEKQVIDKDLSVARDDSPPRHANIRGWPPEKHQRLAIAQDLAAAADLFVHSA